VSRFSGVVENLGIIFTEKCNWKCTYCPNRYNRKPAVCTEKTIQQFLPTIYDIFKYIRYTLVWQPDGELGTLSPAMIDTIFNCIPLVSNIRLNTNGLFIEKGYFKKYYNRISLVRYHCTRELDQPIQFPEYDLDPKVVYIMVCHQDNQHLIKKFKEEYPTIRFEESVTSWILHKKQRIDRPVVEDRNLQIHRGVCRQVMHRPTINLATKRIELCCDIQCKSSVPLTEDNLKKLKCKQLDFPFDSYCHNDCYPDSVIGKFDALLEYQQNKRKYEHSIDNPS